MATLHCIHDVLRDAHEQSDKHTLVHNRFLLWLSHKYTKDNMEPDQAIG